MAEIIFTILNKEQIQARLQTKAEAVGEALLKTMAVEMDRTADWSRKNYFLQDAGKPVPDTLHRRSGNLSRAITGDATLDGRSIVGKIGVSTSAVPYAALHEFGGTVTRQSHMRRTAFNSKLQRVKLLNKNGSVRAQVLKSGAMARNKVGRHTATYPARPYLNPAMVDRGQDILQRLSEIALGVLAQ